MKAAGEGSRSASRRPVRSQNRTCRSRELQTRKGQSERSRLPSPCRTRRATCFSTVSPGMNSSVKMPHSAKYPPNCSTSGGGAPAARSQETSSRSSAKFMSSATLIATSKTSRARVWMERRKTLFPCWRPRRLTAAPPGGMSARDRRTPRPSWKIEARTIVVSAIAWRRWCAAAGGTLSSKTRTSFHPYSAPVCGSMASRRFGPTQFENPRRRRSSSSAARAAISESSWSVSRPSGIRARAK